MSPGGAPSRDCRAHQELLSPAAGRAARFAVELSKNAFSRGASAFRKVLGWTDVGNKLGEIRQTKKGSEETGRAACFE